MLYDALDEHTLLTPRMAAAYDRRIDPNVYAVLHLERSWGGDFGSTKIYKAEVVRFLANLTRRLIGKHAFRRREKSKRLLRNISTFEGLGNLPHVNIMLHRPDWICFENFQAIFLEEWLRIPWPSRWKDAIFCEERQVGSSVVGYSSKPGSILIMEALTLDS